MNREKQVSVRFAAVGGNATKAEMRGIGLAGREAMQEIGQSSTLAESGIEQISAAALKARMDLEAMATKSMQSALAMRTTIPAQSDLQARVMQSTGVTSASGLSASETLRQGQALDDLRAKMNPLYNEIRRYKQAVSEVRAAHLEGAISADEQAAAIARLRTSSLQAIDGIKGISAANREAARAAEEAAMATAREAQQMSDLRARYNPVYAATRQYKSALADLNLMKEKGIISSQEHAAALEREAERMRTSIMLTNSATQQLSRSARMGTFRMQQMFYQVNDIGVSIAGGMNPFLVMAQQGTQIAQIYGFGNGGVGGIFKDLGKMMRGLVTASPVLTAAIVATGAAVAGMTYEINQTTDVAVGMQDTFLAVFQVIGRGIAKWIKPATDKIAEWFSAAWDKVVFGVKWAGNAIIKGVQLFIADISFGVATIPDMFLAAFNTAVSHVLTKMHDMVWYVAQAINGIAGQFNEVFGTEFSTNAMSGIIDTLSQSSGDYMQSANAARDRIASARDGYRDRQDEIMASDPMGDFYSAVRDQAIENAKNRQDKDKKKGGAGRGGRAKERDEIAELVEALKQELAVLRETDPIKKKMLEYADKLAGATDQQRAMVQGLVEQLDRAKFGWEAVSRSLMEYSQEAKRIGDDIGAALTGAFSAAEDAVADFVTSGKLSFSDMVSSMIADLARLSTQKFITGPLSAGLGAALDGIGGGGGFGGFLDAFKGGFNSYDGGGHTGYGARSGGLDGRGGFLAMMHPQERVYDEARGQRAPAMAAGPTVINFNGVRDVESFRRSRAQVAADLQRGLSAGRRTM